MDTEFSISFEDFGDGLSPLAHIDSKTFKGSKGQASEMRADVISNPGFLQQSPALSTLENGDQTGVVTEQIRYILDKPVASDTTYAVGTSKLFKLSSTAVANNGWPQTISNMTEGESLVRLKANLYGFYNKSSGGDIFKMPLSTGVVTTNWGSTTDLALEKALHPVAAKEDIMVFGNGRYLGVYIEGEGILDTQRLDFGEGAEVADVVFHSNMWWIAVNYGEGRRGQIYLYDGSAMSNILSDEVGLGSQRIGFLFVLNGIVYVCYDDLTADGFAIGWISGRQIKPLRYFSGTLPNHRQKTLYKNTILFVSGSDIYSFGAPVEQVPIQISRLASAGYSNVGGIAAPFGVPMVASSDGTSNYKLAKFSGLATSGSYWKSVFVDTTKNRKLGKIHTVIVSTKALESGARADLKLEGNQGAISSNTMQITGASKTRHVFRTVNLKAVEDVRVAIDYQNGSTSKNCPIRKIELLGNFVER